jgi:hypothetical protein
MWKIDSILLIISLLLMATLMATFLGLFPYPFGGIILLVLFMARLVYLKTGK